MMLCGTSTQPSGLLLTILSLSFYGATGAALQRVADNDDVTTNVPDRIHLSLIQNRTENFTSSWNSQQKMRQNRVARNTPREVNGTLPHGTPSEKGPLNATASLELNLENVNFESEANHSALFIRENETDANNSLASTNVPRAIEEILKSPRFKALNELLQSRSDLRQSLDSIISLSPEVPNLVKGFITHSHVDLMKPETLIVKHEQGSEPQIGHIYTTSPTVDGMVYGELRPFANHDIDAEGTSNNFESVFTKPPQFNQHNHQSSSFYNNIQNIPNTPLYSEVHLPSNDNHRPPYYGPETIHGHRPGIGIVEQITIPAPHRPFRPAFSASVVSSTVIGVAVPPPQIQYMEPSAESETNQDHHSEESEFGPVQVIEESLEDEMVTELVSSSSIPYPTQKPTPNQYFISQITELTTTSAPPYHIYNSVPTTINQDPAGNNCPNVTVIVSPTITNNNVQNIAAPPPGPTYVYRPPNYPPPNIGGHYQYKPPGQISTQVINVPYDDELTDDAELANQEATVPPTEAPSSVSPSEEPPPVTESTTSTAVTTTVRPSVFTDLANVFFNTSSPVFWLALMSPVVVMLSLIVGMTRYVAPIFRSSSHYVTEKTIEHPYDIIIEKPKLRPTTKKPPKRKKKKKH
ncbi:uncharacterized protein LOC132201967 [Neocloeon triangulifer]|uniref:uncharacterized protein LOC132201967 n=1 Tax=Neocloeon triangulifer TaxID=2078957 RepID=UPI00286F2A7E|nr:uncharacterized protein LOC132201967 [Neocloeon triangulifer]